VVVDLVDDVGLEPGAAAGEDDAAPAALLEP